MSGIYSTKEPSLDTLEDVNINPSTLANNDLIQYNSTRKEWDNGTLDLTGTDLSINNLDLSGTLSINGSSGNSGAYLLSQGTSDPVWRRPYFLKVELETEDNTGTPSSSNYTIGVDGQARPLVAQFTSNFNYNNGDWEKDDTSVWTCPKTGIYRINAQVGFKSSGDNDRIQFTVIEFYKDTTRQHLTEMNIAEQGASSPDDFIEYTQSMNVLMEFNETQTFEMRLRFFRRGTSNMIIRADGKTFICIERVAE